ncbi:MAG: trimethylamine methyltransferase family protein [Anaerolineales bacterium]
MARKIGFLEVLTPEHIRSIHIHALRVLEEVGVWFPNEEVLKCFHDGGAIVDFDSQKVWIPSQLSETCIRKFPSRFTWYARNPKKSLDMSGTETYYSFPDSTIRILDLEGNRRSATATDGENICRICDALPNLDASSTGINPPEMPLGVLQGWMAKTMFTYSSKPVFGTCINEKVSELTLEMARIVADTCDHLPPGQLPLMIIMNPISPLYDEPGQLEGMMVYLKHGLPIAISPEVQAGATGPATLAGTMVQQTAEFLAHAILAQLVNPGTPVVYGTVSSIFDMKKMILPYGAPEADLLGIATVQMARFYGIPARMTGGSSDANALGMQAGIESLMSTLLPLLAGATFVLHGAGELENTMTVSYEKILVDEEVIAMSRRFMEGIDVTPETLGFDVIKEVGPTGHFLATDHTMEYFQKEQFMPSFMVRENFEEWKKSGEKRAEERARDRARDLIEHYQPDPLPEEAIQEIDAIYETFSKEIEEEL